MQTAAAAAAPASNIQSAIRPLHTLRRSTLFAYPTWLVNLQCLQQLTYVCGCIWCMCAHMPVCVCVGCVYTVRKHCAYFLIECAGNWLSRTWAWSWLWAMAIVAYSIYMYIYLSIPVCVCICGAHVLGLTVTFKQFAVRLCVSVPWITALDLQRLFPPCFSLVFSRVFCRFPPWNCANNMST